MGVDLRLWAVGDFSDADIARLDERVSAMGGHIVRKQSGAPGVEWVSLTRYWGPGYERGPWPNIFAVWKLLSTTGNPVFYSDDGATEQYEEPFTQSDADRFWDHWVSDYGNAYERKVATLNEERRARYA